VHFQRFSLFSDEQLTWWRLSRPTPKPKTGLEFSFGQFADNRSEHIKQDVKELYCKQSREGRDSLREPRDFGGLVHGRRNIRRLPGQMPII